MAEILMGRFSFFLYEHCVLRVPFPSVNVYLLYDVLCRQHGFNAEFMTVSGSSTRL